MHACLTGTLAAAVAHELNNTLLAAAMLAESPSADNSLDSRLAPLINESQSLSATLLALAISPTPSSPSRTDLSKWLRHHTAHLARTSPPSIHVACKLPTAAIHAHTNPIALDQVLRTLASNAIEAMDSKGELLFQLVAPAHADDPIELRVSDTGPRVPSHLRHRIFDLGFSTRDPSRQRGLGLALARNLVQQLGGSLTYQPNFPRGTSFVIRLPRHFLAP